MPTKPTHETRQTVESCEPLAHNWQTPKVAVLGVEFHAVNFQSALRYVDEFIRQRSPRQVCLANAFTLSLAIKDIELARVLQKADLVLADGMSIVWGSRWIGVHLPGRVAGPDLTLALCEQAQARGHRIFLLGSTPDTLQMLIRNLMLKWPRLSIAGHYCPPVCDRLSETENDVIESLIRQCCPDILLVCMSTPKQEKWIAQNLDRLQVPVCIGVGAAFDFISGRVPRAPAWLQNIGLEWLYRLWCEPRRLWRRYLLGNAIFLSSLLSHKLSQKL
jgi:N-acetylglucosaminyldiphosphoundecaprenol N-acetyl-beta-D-mannosaminyltransferase